MTDKGEPIVKNDVPTEPLTTAECGPSWWEIAHEQLENLEQLATTLGVPPYKDGKDAWAAITLEGCEGHRYNLVSLLLAHVRLMQAVLAKLPG